MPTTPRPPTAAPGENDAPPAAAAQADAFEIDAIRPAPTDVLDEDGSAEDDEEESREDYGRTRLLLADLLQRNGPFVELSPRAIFERLADGSFPALVDVPMPIGVRLYIPKSHWRRLGSDTFTSEYVIGKDKDVRIELPSSEAFARLLSLLQLGKSAEFGTVSLNNSWKLRFNVKEMQRSKGYRGARRKGEAHAVTQKLLLDYLAKNPKSFLSHSYAIQVAGGPGFRGSLLRPQADKPKKGKPSIINWEQLYWDILAALLNGAVRPEDQTDAIFKRAADIGKRRRGHFVAPNTATFRKRLKQIKESGRNG